jgi:hypothetical protein
MTTSNGIDKKVINKLLFKLSNYIMKEAAWIKIKKLFSEKFRKSAALIFIILGFSLFSFIERMVREGWSFANFLIIILTLFCLYLINENNKLYERIEKRFKK